MIHSNSILLTLYFVLISEPTYFVRIPTPKRLILEAGETAEVFCEAVADSRLPIKYQWTINGKVLTESQYYE